MKKVKSAVVLLGAVVLVVAVLLVVRWKGGPGQEKQLGVDVGVDQSATRLEMNRSALMATEDLNSVAADDDWSSLYLQTPEDESIARNRALNRVLIVDSLTEKANNSTLDAEEKQGARKLLPSAISAARSAINDYAKTANDQTTAIWLRSRVDLHEASLLPSSMTKMMRKEVFQRLVTAIEGEHGEESSSVILGGPLTQVIDEMEHPVEGLPKEIQRAAATALAALSNRNKDNLYIALRAAKLNLAIESSEAITSVKRTLELSRSIEPSLRRQTEPIGMTPSELVDQILIAIDKKEWSNAENQMLLWFNVLNSTELVKTDRRRASPHPLDRLSFDSLRRIAAQVAAETKTMLDSEPIKFNASEIETPSNVDSVLPIDFDLDLDPDLAAITTDGNLLLLQNTPSGWELDAELSVGMPLRGLIAADLFMVDSSDSSRIQVSSAKKSEEGGEVVVSGARHNTLVTLVAFGSEGIKLISVDGRPDTQPPKRLSMVEKETGLEDVGQVTTVVAGDLEGDGDLDLMIATKNKGLRAFVNRGNRTFFEVANGPSSSLGAEQSIVSMAMVDLDRDLDLDFVTLDESGRTGLIENLLHLQFRFRPLQSVPAISSPSSVQIADIDGNISWDLIVNGRDQTLVVYSQTAEASNWSIEHVDAIKIGSSGSLVADFNNDLWLELICAGEVSAKGIHVGASPENVVQSIEGSLPKTSLVASDMNSDGLLDVVGVDGGKLILATNASSTKNHYLDIRFRGIDDNNANSGRVNHYAIGSVIEVRVGPYYRSEVITGPTTHFGLGPYKDSAAVRIIFPNGLTQTIGNPTVDTLVEEEQTLKGSCPYLYAWNGQEYGFVTDCLWAAPLGLQIADGVVAKDRPWEYLKVNGDSVRPRDDRYELRITEELWEVAYFDHVDLVAVDHPHDVDIWTNEKVGSGDIASPTIFAFNRSNVQSLKEAMDTSGRDCVHRLSQIDKSFVQGFDRRIRQGLCPPHWIDLDFGNVFSNDDGKDQSIYLVLTGWILPTDTSLNIQIDQNPELQLIEFPSLWIPDAKEEGGWRKVIPFIGFPGGKTKTIVVDVSEVLSRTDSRVRIRTSAQIYWDCAELVIQDEPEEFRKHSLKLLKAELAEHGYSKRMKASAMSPEVYEYAEATLARKWPPLRGRLTRFGDCRELLTAWDDRMVVMSSGDEMRLEFSVPQEAIPEGWQRDFVLHCVGWDKDADLNTLSGQSADPLPFRAMATYPPTRAQTELYDKAERANEYHRLRSHRFREFWYRPNE